MLVIVPSRGRPDNIRRLIQAWRSTEAKATLLVVVDSDDPELNRYMSVDMPSPGVQLEILTRQRLGPTLSNVARRRSERSGVLPTDIISFMGDDHVPQTPHWDVRVEDAFMGQHAVVYGNDLVQGPNLPTAVFMTAGMIRTLGYMCPPGFTHMYLDNVWKAWGEGMARLRYLPDVVIQHVHPITGLTQWDDRYVEVAGYMGSDEQAWQQYRQTRLNYDLNRLKELMND